MMRTIINSHSRGLITALLAVLAAGALFFGFLIRINLKPKPEKPAVILQQTPAPADQTGSMYFSPARQIVKKGSEFTVKLYLDTGNVNVIGADAVIAYDPASLKITEIQKPETGFNTYPRALVDDRTGKIVITGIYRDPRGAVLPMNSVFAVIKMRAKKTGEGRLRLNFKENDSSFSVITAASDAKNILSKTSDAEYAVNE